MEGHLNKQYQTLPVEVSEAIIDFWGLLDNNLSFPDRIRAYSKSKYRTKGAAWHDALKNITPEEKAVDAHPWRKCHSINYWIYVVPLEEWEIYEVDHDDFWAGFGVPGDIEF